MPSSPRSPAQDVHTPRPERYEEDSEHVPSPPSAPRHAQASSPRAFPRAGAATTAEDVTVFADDAALSHTEEGSAHVLPLSPADESVADGPRTGHSLHTAGAARPSSNRVNVDSDDSSPAQPPTTVARSQRGLAGPVSSNSSTGSSHGSTTGLLKNPLTAGGQCAAQSTRRADADAAACSQHSSGSPLCKRRGKTLEGSATDYPEAVVDTADGEAAAAAAAAAGGGADAGVAPVNMSPVLQRLAAPKTADEYFEKLKELDRYRCPLGTELSPEAKEMFGPTIGYNKKMPHTRVLYYKNVPAPNCDHKEEVRLMYGRTIYIQFILMAAFAIYAALNTAAYVRHVHWLFIFFMWVLYAMTLGFGMVTSFSNPGIAPRRQYTKDIPDGGDVIVVRVPAPNARAVHERQHEEAMKEVRAATSTGVQRRQNKTTSGLEQYFESTSGRLFPVAPLYGDEERQVCRPRRSPFVRWFLGDVPPAVSVGAKAAATPASAAPDNRPKEVAVVEFPLTYCWTCGRYKGPRTHHCGKCNYCVDDHDHHCPWTGCCIGRGNYRFFFLMLLSLHAMVVLTLGYTLADNFLYLIHNPRKDYRDLLAERYYLPPLLYAVVFGVGIFFTPLFLGHVYMCAVGFSTSELVKAKFSESSYFLGVNPWSCGFFRNYGRRLVGYYDKWTDTRYYYAVTIAVILEGKRIDWLLNLPKGEREKVQAADAKARLQMETDWDAYIKDKYTPQGQQAAA